MALLDDLINDSRPVSKTACRVAVILNELDGVDVDGDDAGAVLRDAMQDPRVTPAAMCRLINSLGHEVAYTTVGRHRKNECACSHRG